MSKLGNRGIPVTIEEIAIEQGVIENEYNYKLVREHDGLTNQSKDIMWIEWNDEGRFKEKHNDIGVGRSLIMSPFNQFFTWQTTVVTEILACEADSSYIKFKTNNSTYELFKL
jgi:hypothetical protein